MLGRPYIPRARTAGGGHHPPSPGPPGRPSPRKRKRARSALSQRHFQDMRSVVSETSPNSDVTLLGESAVACRESLPRWRALVYSVRPRKPLPVYTRSSIPRWYSPRPLDGTSTTARRGSMIPSEPPAPAMPRRDTHAVRRLVRDLSPL